MGLINVKELLIKYPLYKAFCAFNIINLETLNSVIEVGEELKVPLIVMLTPKTLKYAGMEEITWLTIKKIEKSTCEFVLHLDHAKDFSLILKCIKMGFSSVMYDGSDLPLEENIKNTKEIVKIAHSLGVTVEGEIGYIGGKEEKESSQTKLTKVEEALLFCNETEVDILAPSVGTVHGIHRERLNIDFDLIKKLNESLNIPLALHGGSDIPDNILKEIVNNGFKKINIGTDLMLALTTSLKDFLEENPNIYDIRKIMEYATEDMKKVIRHKIKILTL